MWGVDDWVVDLGAQGLGRGSVFSLPDWLVLLPMNKYNTVRKIDQCVKGGGGCGKLMTG